MKIRTFSTLVCALLLVVSLGACKKKNKLGSGVDGDYDYVSGTPLSDRNEGASFFGGNVNRGQFPGILFGYDSFSVDGGEMAKVRQVADFVRPSAKDLIVAGFTDERGTAEYNRALGERRAQSVREALIGMGVDASKIQTVSFGEEMPADAGGGEAAWARNRRAEFGVVN
jgi:peptidoglycan-associated lipoprotein